MPTAASASSATVATQGFEDSNADFVTRRVAKKPNTQLRLLEERLVRVRDRFASAGAEHEGALRKLEALLLRLQALKAHVLLMGAMARFANRNAEAVEVEAIASAIDRIVAA